VQLFGRAAPATVESLALTDYTLKEVPKPEDYIAGVKEALARFARGELDKVVLSRTLEIDCKQALDVKALVRRLEARNASGYTFAVRLQDSTLQHERGTLIGASPELLISRRGNRIIANPLAGSEPRSEDPLIDQARAEQLLASPKDRREHALVIGAVVEALRPFCRELKVPAEPQLINTPTMWHLSTLIEGELADTETSSIDLALALHPTPAVCGYPRQAARKAITEIEAYDRGLFTGMVGWCDDSGDGEWVVTIRCAEVASHSIRLYAGAGIIAGSSPEKELAETGAKFNTMLNALGISERV
jgi:isochorismate synthase